MARVSGSLSQQATLPRISHSFLAARLFFRNVLERKGSDFYNDIDEVVVFKTCRNARGHKIHGYYDADFKLDKSKIADVHNVLYGYGH